MTVIRPLALALALALTLTACQTTARIVETKTYIVVTPDPGIYNQCKLVPLPDPENMTNADVAGLIITLNTMNKKCVNTINTIKKFLADAKVKIEHNP